VGQGEETNAALAVLETGGKSVLGEVGAELREEGVTEIPCRGILKKGGGARRGDGGDCKLRRVGRRKIHVLRTSGAICPR